MPQYRVVVCALLVLLGAGRMCLAQPAWGGSFGSVPSPNGEAMYDVVNAYWSQFAVRRMGAFPETGLATMMHAQVLNPADLEYAWFKPAANGSERNGPDFNDQLSRIIYELSGGVFDQRFAYRASGAPAGRGTTDQNSLWWHVSQARVSAASIASNTSGLSSNVAATAANSGSLLSAVTDATNPRLLAIRDAVLGIEGVVGFMSQNVMLQTEAVQDQTYTLQNIETHSYYTRTGVEQSNVYLGTVVEELQVNFPLLLGKLDEILQALPGGATDPGGRAVGNPFSEQALADQAGEAKQVAAAALPLRRPFHSQAGQVFGTDAASAPVFQFTIPFPEIGEIGGDFQVSADFSHPALVVVYTVTRGIFLALATMAAIAIVWNELRRGF